MRCVHFTFCCHQSADSLFPEDEATAVGCPIIPPAAPPYISDTSCPFCWFPYPLIAFRASRCNSEDVLLPNFVSWRSVKRSGRGTHVASTAHFTDVSGGFLPQLRDE